MDEAMLNFLVHAVNNVGFPIVVIGYLFFRFEKKLSALDHSIQELDADFHKRKKAKE
ncbi:YvrJ family protein [Paenibacillus tuaregi]|uniref:YvrJ family protein n=1 Tax=Paenibacillus tuaregi TaxID=1816681 RepID=UPI0009EF32ED|nr:YvrJ family protein [Paenibacillus tuaregi]